ncbi:MAG: hypothetical protein IKM99_10885 [Bacteroidales bacterium]|nr:hypothetical protein [Bacteroidales bacterium]MBR3711443.1 hypothetical protein [Bacteroidales bacterium]
MKNLFIAVLLFMLAACHPIPRNVKQAARDALENARIQLDSGNKAEALQLFKDAEQYGLLADDTLTVARARYQIGCMLYRKGETKEEYMWRLKAAEPCFGTHDDERALLLNLMGSAYIAFREFDSAEMYINQALSFAEKSQNQEVYLTVMTNYFVLNVDQDNYDKAAEQLWKFKSTTGLKTAEQKLYYCQSLGTVYDAADNIDSAAYYFREYEAILQDTNTMKGYEPYWDYLTLEKYAELRGDSAKALWYFEHYIIENGRAEYKKEKESLYSIQKKYDYEVLRNELNQKIIHKQRIIIFISGLAALVLAAFLVSQVRLARKRKQEAEINAELFHFKQQNKALVQKDAEHERIQQDYSDRLSEVLDKEQQTMMLLDIYLNNSKKVNLLNDLERSVFGEKDHWKAMLAVVEEKYPGLWETLGQKYPDLDEDEKKSFILSHFKVSRQEEADYLGTTVNMVDKLRGRVRKKMDKDH